MKTAIAFILVSLSCCFGSLNAVNPETCLTQLFQNDAPAFVQQLGNLLCKYQLAKKTQNQQLFVAFLEGVNNILEDVGCTLDDLLGMKVVPSLQNAEQIADKVAVILFGFLNDLLASVTTVLKDLPSLVSDVVDTLLPEIATLLDVLEHIEDVKNVACDVLEDILPEVAKILSIGGEILNRVLNDLGLAARTHV